MSGTVIYPNLLSDGLFFFSFFTIYNLQLQLQYFSNKHQNIKESCQILKLISNKFDMQFEDICIEMNIFEIFLVKGR